MKVIGNFLMKVMVRLKVSLNLFCCKFFCVCVVYSKLVCVQVVAEVCSKLLTFVVLWVVAA